MFYDLAFFGCYFFDTHFVPSMKTIVLPVLEIIQNSLLQQEGGQ